MLKMSGNSEPMTKIATILFLFTSVLAGCAVTQEQNVPNPAPLIKEPITGRTYKLYVSSRYNRSRPAPVIISLHGTAPWDTADRQAMEWKKIAEDQGAILVCPTLLSSGGMFPPGDTQLHKLLLQDELFLLTILGQLHFKFNIDRRNIFLTSWSGGGFPLWFIGLRHPDIFSAICARQSNFRRSTVDGWYPDAARQMPVLIFYGSSDLAPIVNQSKNAYGYLTEKGFQSVTITTTPGGHVRHPEIAIEFFLRHWQRGPYRAGILSPHMSDGT